MRRLLIIPAFVLVVLGTPVLATEGTTPPHATTSEVAVAPPKETVGQGWTSAPAPIDGQLVGVTFQGDPNAEFTVQVQSSDGSWSERTAVESDLEPDTGTQDGANVAKTPDRATEPVWVGDDATAVRVSLTSGTAFDVSVTAVDSGEASVPSGAAGAFGLMPITDGPGRYYFAGALLVVAALLVAFALGWSPWRSRRLRALLVVVTGAAVLAGCIQGVPDGSVTPAIHSRAEWGAYQFGTGVVPCPAGPEYASALRFAVVHHTVNSNNYTAAQVPAMLRGIQVYHMNTLGYCDIAYNFVIDRFGGIWEARDGGVDKPVIGGHAGGFNTGSVGVALLGNNSTAAVPDAQYRSLVQLLRWRLSIARIDPSLGFIVTVGASPCNCQQYPVGYTIFLPSAIVGHRDVDKTECPGNEAYKLLPWLRLDVKAGLNFPTTTTTSSTTTTT
jgi:N-acetylmuramoyl-L-alanine amidase